MKGCDLVGNVHKGSIKVTRCQLCKFVIYLAKWDEQDGTTRGELEQGVIPEVLEFDVRIVVDMVVWFE